MWRSAGAQIVRYAEDDRMFVTHDVREAVCDRALLMPPRKRRIGHHCD